MFITVALLSIVIIALVVLGLGVQTFFSKKKSFPNFHISKNKEMRKRKIQCAKTQQKMIDKGLDIDDCNFCN